MFSLPQLGYLGLLAAIGVFIAVLNPFGSVSDLPVHIALAYWVPLIVYGGIAGALMASALRVRLQSLPLWAYILVLSLTMTVVVFPAVALSQAYLLAEPVPWANVPLFLFYVLVINIAVIGGIVLGFRAFGRRSGLLDPEPSSASAAAPTGSADGAAFAKRLPIRLRSADIYAVESEDHYLRVHTSAGQELILMRLADAVRELSSVDGLQTHRSWWVAKQGLADIVKGDGRVVLKLKSGAEAPVSRTYLKSVREAGWL